MNRSRSVEPCGASAELDEELALGPLKQTYICIYIYIFIYIYIYIYVYVYIYIYNVYIVLLLLPLVVVVVVVEWLVWLIISYCIILCVIVCYIVLCYVIIIRLYSVGPLKKPAVFIAVTATTTFQ